MLIFCPEAWPKPAGRPQIPLIVRLNSNQCFLHCVAVTHRLSAVFLSMCCLHAEYNSPFPETMTSGGNTAMNEGGVSVIFELRGAFVL